MATDIKPESIYVSAACNRYPNTLDWGTKLIAYATSNAICVYNVCTYKVEHMLKEHTGQVNCVRWLSNDQKLLSSSADKSVKIWDFNPQTQAFESVLNLTNHSGPVISADSLVVNDRQITVTVDSSFTLRIFDNDDLKVTQKTKNYQFDVRIIHNKSFSNSIFVAHAGGDEVICLCLYSNCCLKELLKLPGHEDWIRTLDYTFRNNELFIAAGSQDNFIRVWKICDTPQGAKTGVNEKIVVLDSCETLLIKLETVLAGHEGWVYAVRFDQKSALRNEQLALVSCSIDKSVIVWQEPSADGDVWTEVARMGEVGGNNLGYLGCSLSDDSELKRIVGHSFTGAVHIWTNNKELGRWESDIGFGGHFDVVSDISWSKRGNYLCSASHDETTRLHSPWLHENSIETWHEIARPQIHGYLINCLTMLSDTAFVTGADEKVLRIFRATQSFATSFKNISKCELTTSENLVELAHGASVPSLGLSNRPVTDAQVITDDSTVFRPVLLEKPPTEEDLMQNTLWPEMQKLYGHGYELYAVGSNSTGTLIATACKATKSEHAQILLWDANHEQVAKLEGHQLTVTSIKFSPNDEYVLSGSRDRTWCLFRIVKTNNKYSASRVAYSDKKTGVHGRIIWDVAWSFDSQLFLTVSRDGKAVFWNMNNSEGGDILSHGVLGRVSCATNSVLELEVSINSCDILGKYIDNCLLIALGLEDGRVAIYKWNQSQSFSEVSISQLHHMPVRRVRWRPVMKSITDPIDLATCSDDRIVLISRYQI